MDSQPAQPYLFIEKPFPCMLMLLPKNSITTVRPLFRLVDEGECNSVQYVNLGPLKNIIIDATLFDCILADYTGIRELNAQG